MPRKVYASGLGVSESSPLTYDDLRYQFFKQFSGLSDGLCSSDYEYGFYLKQLNMPVNDRSLTINDLRSMYFDMIGCSGDTAFENGSASVGTVRTNLATNPSFEATSGTVEVRRNYATDPRSTAAYTRMGDSTSTVTLGTTAPPPGFTSYTRMTGASTGWSGVAITPQIATVPGETITASALVRSTTTPGATARVYILFYDSAGTWLSETPVGTIVGSDFARISQTGVVPAGAAFFAVQVRPPDAWGTANTLDITGVLVEKTPVVLPYFDGSMGTTFDADLTAAWTGTANNSPSILTGVGLSGVATVSGRAYCQSPSWHGTGTTSVRIFGATSAGDSFVSIPVAFPGPNRTVRLTGRVRLSAALTGQLAASFANFRVQTTGNVESPVTAVTRATNAPGEYVVTGIITTPASATGWVFVRLYNGASAGNGDVWWDNLLIEDITNQQHPRPKLYFDGSFSEDRALTPAWTGPIDGSTSIATGLIWTP